MSGLITGMLLGFVGAMAIMVPVLSTATHQIPAARAQSAAYNSAALLPNCSAPNFEAMTLPSALPTERSNLGVLRGSQGSGQLFIKQLLRARLATNAANSTNTGPQSNNSIVSTTNRTTKIINSNNVLVKSSTRQQASTGAATVNNNTFGGSAASGRAENWNSAAINVLIHN